MSRNKRYQQLLNSKEWGEVKRLVWLRAGGLCERCKREGFITAGVDCHHIKPVESAKTKEEMKRLAYDWQNNIELLCVACHIKTHQEMRSHTKEKVAENKRRDAQRRAALLDPNYAIQREQCDACIDHSEREHNRTQFNYTSQQGQNDEKESQ